MTSVVYHMGRHTYISPSHNSKQVELTSILEADWLTSLVKNTNITKVVVEWLVRLAAKLKPRRCGQLGFSLLSNGPYIQVALPSAT